jgi:hypothetical protein
MQRRSLRVGVARLPGLVDLPVDSYVVLEQQEGAKRLGGRERAA